MHEHALIGLASILFLGMAARWIAWHLHLPSILLLLVFGMIAGPMTGFLDPDALFGELLLPIVSLSVAVILFEGGLSLSFRDVKEVGSIVRNLVTIGVLVTWMLTAGLAYLFLGLEPALAVLFGAILVVTGPTVIGPLLRHVRPVANIRTIVQWEGILNDPIGALLAVLVFEFEIVRGGTTTNLGDVVGQFVAAIGIGTGVGIAAAIFTVVVLKFYWIPDFLENAFSLTMVVTAFTISDHYQTESGLLATTVMGIVLANQRFSKVAHIVEFKENLRVLIISSLFILLAARLQISDLAEIGLGGLAFLVALVVVVRPVSVWLSTIGSNLTLDEKIFVSCLAPRGIVAAAVTSVFAERLVDAGYESAERLVPSVFAVIIVTVTLYGLGAFPLARRLNLAESSPQGVLFVGAHGWARMLAKALEAIGFRVAMLDSDVRKIEAAKADKLSASHDSILSEKVVDEVDLYGVGSMLAVTSNDEANALAAIHFAEALGEHHAYQLTPDTAAAFSTSGSGNLLFAEGITYEWIERRIAAGAVIRTTRLNEKLDYAALRKKQGDSSLLLFVVQPDGKLQVQTTRKSSTPKPGDTVVCLVSAAVSAPVQVEF